MIPDIVKMIVSQKGLRRVIRLRALVPKANAVFALASLMRLTAMRNARLKQVIGTSAATALRRRVVLTFGKLYPQ